VVPPNRAAGALRGGMEDFFTSWAFIILMAVPVVLLTVLQLVVVVVVVKIARNQHRRELEERK
jgi:hypothetical protein